MLHLLEGPIYIQINEDREEKKLRTQRESNPQPLCSEVCALPLCYNHCLSRDSLTEYFVGTFVFVKQNFVQERQVDEDVVVRFQNLEKQPRGWSRSVLNWLIFAQDDFG